MIDKERFDMNDIESRSNIETLKIFGYETLFRCYRGRNKNPISTLMVLVE